MSFVLQNLVSLFENTASNVADVALKCMFTFLFDGFWGFDP